MKLPHRLLAAAALLLSVARPAKAIPAYSIKEQKPCGYCHVSSDPGYVDASSGAVQTTSLNQRGLYYQAHQHSFAGYVERPASTESFFQFKWRVTLKAAVTRVAVADIRGDGQPALICLEKPQQPKEPPSLAVFEVAADGVKQALSAAAPGQPDQMEAGRFAGKTAPAVVVTSDAVWHWRGGSLVPNKLDHPVSLFGAVRMRNGEERVLVRRGPGDVEAFLVNPSAAGDAQLTSPIRAPTDPSQFQWADMHAPPQDLLTMGLPVAMAAGGLIGVWHTPPPARPRVVIYEAHVNQDFDVQTDPANPGKPKFTLKSQTWGVEAHDTAVAAPDAIVGPGIFYTGTLPGAVLDIVPESPRKQDGPGLLVLTSAAPDGAGEGLYFFSIK